MMQYISQLNAFNERCLVTGLGANARIVYYSLLHMSNKLFWPAEFRTTVRILAVHSGLEKDAVHRALIRLVDDGLIQYTPSKKRGKGSLVRIIPLKENLSHGSDRNRDKTATDSATDSATETATLKRQRQDKDKTTAAARASTPVLSHGSDRNRDKTATDSPELAEVVRLFENCIHPIANEVEREELLDMVQMDGYGRVKDAIREAAKSRAQSVRYIYAILNRWRKEGQNGRSAGRGGRANQSADQEKRKWENEPNGWRHDLAI